ncbi:MAG: outer membrane protein transport protein, partial [Rhodospirillales bacterium]|nr:outer membrane protein transport protein [Rhodospirillales bacterium]
MRKVASRVRLAPLVGLVVAVGFAGTAQASGFQLREQGAEDLGLAVAGSAARADGLSTVYFNPAGMTRLHGTQIGGSASFIAPSAKFSSGGATTRAGTGIAGGNGGDAGVPTPLAANYLMTEVTPDLRLGLAINTPWGLGTKYESDWVGRYHAIETSMLTINVAPSVAYKLGKLSLGGALQVEYARAKLSNAVDFGLLMRTTPGSADGFALVEGDSLAVGTRLGLLYEFDPATRAGITWHSGMTHKVEGSAEFSNVPAALSRNFQKNDATSKLVVPDVVTASLYRDITPSLALMGTVEWTNWSRFRSMVINFSSPTLSPSITPEHWKDSWLLSVGGKYKVTDRLALLGGLAYDQSPVPDEYRTPRIPDQSRTWISLGATYDLSQAVSFSAGYTHIFAKEADLNLREPATTGAPGFSKGNVTGTYDSSV